MIRKQMKYWIKFFSCCKILSTFLGSVLQIISVISTKTFLLHCIENLLKFSSSSFQFLLPSQFFLLFSLKSFIFILHSDTINKEKGHCFVKLISELSFNTFFSYFDQMGSYFEFMICNYELILCWKFLRASLIMIIFVLKTWYSSSTRHSTILLFKRYRLLKGSFYLWVKRCLSKRCWSELLQHYSFYSIL